MATHLYDNAYYGSGLGRYSESRQKHKSFRIPLDDAIDDLDIILEEAIGFYTQFKKDFEYEIAGIKSYANSNVLGYLWTSKTKESDNPRSTIRTYNGRTRETHYEPEEKMPKCGFRMMAKQICRFFEIAIAAASNLLAHRSNREIRSDLQVISWGLKKLKDAYDDIHTRLRYASKRTSDIDALLTELRMASTFLKADRTKRIEGLGISEPLSQSCVGYIEADEDGPENPTRNAGDIIPYLHTND